MNHKEEVQKVKNKSEMFSNILHKSADVSKKIAQTAIDGTKTAVEKIKEKNEVHQKEKLNPLFLKEYKSKSFNIPNIIKIVDDAERRKIAICDGAIGWRQTENNTEVLFLYDETKEICGLQFVPTFNCNSIYCVDPFDRKKFIKADCIFSKAQEEKLAELENIAYCLGAKSCSIEIVSFEADRDITKKSFGIESKKVSVVTENSQSQSNAQQSTGKTIVQFKGHDNPTRPTLKWFTYDDTVKNLIEMRCNQPDSVKSRTLALSGASSATMSQQTAIAIDGLLKNIKVKAKGKMESQINREMNSKLVFEIEF